MKVSLGSRITKFMVFGLLVFWILKNSSISNTEEILKLSTFIIIVFSIVELLREIYIKNNIVNKDRCIKA